MESSNANLNPFLPSGAPQTDLRSVLTPILAELDANRTLTYRKCINATIFCVIGGLLGMAAVYAALNSSSPGGAGWIVFVPLFIAMAVFAFIMSSARKNYTHSFKAQVLPLLVRQFGDLNYYPGSGLTQGEFIRANLHSIPDRYSSEDLFEGKIGATRLRFSEVHAEERRERSDSNGNTQTSYETIFRGLFFIADFNKEFQGITYIFPEGVTGKLGSFGKSLQSLGGKASGRGQLVTLEDPRFEQKFIVYSTDQVEARYILSSSLMERFCQLRDRYKGASVSATFLGGSLYLMISSNNNWFEPPSLSTPLTYNSLGKLLQELQLSTGIVNDLDLNTRIWTKR